MFQNVAQRLQIKKKKVFMRPLAGHLTSVRNGSGWRVKTVLTGTDVSFMPDPATHEKLKLYLPQRDREKANIDVPVASQNFINAGFFI